MRSAAGKCCRCCFSTLTVSRTSTTASATTPVTRSAVVLQCLRPAVQVLQRERRRGAPGPGPQLRPPLLRAGKRRAAAHDHGNQDPHRAQYPRKKSPAGAGLLRRRRNLLRRVGLLRGLRRLALRRLLRGLAGLGGLGASLRRLGFRRGGCGSGGRGLGLHADREDRSQQRHDEFLFAANATACA